ncbi:MAG: hypothetical protein OHK0053_18710 [Microscillaceae bacterium]
MGWYAHLGYGQDLSQLLEKANQSQDKAEKASLFRDIGTYYQKKGAWAKAIEYYEQSQALATELAQPLSQQLSTLEALAFNYEQLQDFPKATQQYQKILSVHAAQKNYAAQVDVLATLSRWSIAQQDSSQAIGYQEEILKISQITNNLALAMNTHNNLGALYNRRGDAQKSMMHLQTALNVYESIGALLPNLNQKAQLLLNTGVAYTYLRDYKSATEYYQDAFKLYERNNDVRGTAETYNYLAANYYVSGKNDLATSNALKAVSLALALNDEAILLVSYQILADAYQQSGDYRLSQQYLKSFQELREKMTEKERLTRQRLLEEQIEIEKKENELRAAQAEKERQSAQLRQSELERARQEQDLKIKENELALLRRNQDLQAADLRNQQLEKQRVQQLLEITRQKSLAEKERLLATQQKQEAERQKLLAEKAKIEQEKEQKAREASEKQQKLQQKQLAQEKSIRQYGMALMILGSLVLLLVVIGLISARRNARKLAQQNRQIQEQNNEIEAQNEELHQNQEEIMAQRDFIEQKNRELETFNRQMSSSINAATTIQQAILPYQEKLDRLLKDYFVIYQPKDMVSGDFFWLNEVEEEVVLVVADCTGHGVPGAFMTLIGNTLLDKIVRVWKITEPAQILERLHEEVQIVLRQKETQNNNGMDATVLRWKKLPNGHFKVDFAGAKQNAYYFEAKQNPLLSLKGSRKSIGGLQNEQIHFGQVALELPAHTVFYLGSDGLVDQNDARRRRLGEKKLTEVLESHRLAPLAAQKEALLQALASHQEEQPQRDDILWLGLCLA